MPNLARPRLFTEWVQHRKLHDRDARLPLLADKLAVKAFVADRLGAEWVIPTWWHGVDLPIEAPWPRPFVVKARHGCNQTRFILTGCEDWEAIRRVARRWMRRPYGHWLDEWLYARIERGLLVEPFVGGPGLPIDYKLFVFDGRVRYVQVHLGRGRRHRWIVMDLGWRRVSEATADRDPARPESLAAMIAAAETLGLGFSFVRVDLYEIGGRPLFGEMTFYPGSGLETISPSELNAAMGACWAAAPNAFDASVIAR